MTPANFNALTLGQVVQHKKSGNRYQVSSKVEPFTPRFRKIKKNGQLACEVRTFLAEHVELPDGSFRSFT